MVHCFGVFLFLFFFNPPQFQFRQKCWMDKTSAKNELKLALVFTLRYWLFKGFQCIAIVIIRIISYPINFFPAAH